MGGWQLEEPSERAVDEDEFKNKIPKPTKNGRKNKKARDLKISLGHKTGWVGGGAGSLTIARGVVGQRTSFSRPFIVSNLTHDYRVYEGGRCQGGLTQRTEFQFLDGKGFTLSLFPVQVRGRGRRHRLVRAGAVGCEALRGSAGDGCVAGARGCQRPGLRAFAGGGGGLQPRAHWRLGEEGVAGVRAGPLGPGNPWGLLGQQDGLHEGGVDPVKGAAQRAVGGRWECGSRSDRRGGGSGPGRGERGPVTWESQPGAQGGRGATPTFQPLVSTPPTLLPEKSCPPDPCKSMALPTLFMHSFTHSVQAF